MLCPISVIGRSIQVQPIVTGDEDEGNLEQKGPFPV